MTLYNEEFVGGRNDKYLCQKLFLETKKLAKASF